MSLEAEKKQQKGKIQELQEMSKSDLAKTKQELETVWLSRLK